MAKLLNEYDYASIHAGAMNLMENRKHFKQSALDRWHEHFETKCAKSKAEAAKAQQCIPGGIQHNLANNHPFALTLEKADGPYLYDIDGNKYIDFLCSGGPIILGNNYPTVKEAAINYLTETAPVHGLYSPYERMLAEEINKYMPHIEMFRALASGTEADLMSIRLARVYTGKKHIIRMAGGYHGWSDQLAYNCGATDKDMLNGVPAVCFENTHAVPYNDTAALEAKVAELKDAGIAAIMVEAVGQDSGAVPVTKEFIHDIRRICDENNILMIMDEVVTGFRLGMGGAQSVFGIQADITVFGKIIGGGFGNSGGLGGSREIMNYLGAGVTTDDTPKAKVGGTMSANPLTSLAGYTVIKTLAEENVHEQLDKAADYFMKGIADITERYDIPALVYHHQSILHIDIAGVQHIPYCFAKDDPRAQEQLMDAYQNYLNISMALAAEGLIIANGGKTYLPYSAVKADILDDALDVYERVFKEME